ncbi:MAG TPA: phage holin family protein [Gaiellaceae bacterium]|jgi:putative membrane protein
MRFLRELLFSWIANAVVLAIVALALEDVKFDDVGDLLKAAALFGVLNTILKPILKLVTLPFAVITLGLVWFGVAMLMLWLTAAVVDGFSIHGLTTLFWATLIVWAVNVVLDFVPGPWRARGKDK